MVAELHAGDGAAGLGAIEGGRCAEAVGGGERAPIGEAAAVGGGKEGRGSLRIILLHEPVARCMGTRDRRNQQLRVRVLGSLHDPLHGACFGDVSAVTWSTESPSGSCGRLYTTPSTINDIWSLGRPFASSEPKPPPGGKVRLPSHETRFDLAASLDRTPLP